MGWLFKKTNRNDAGRQSRLSPALQDTYTFRRSRTLIGTTSPKISTSAEQNSQLKTSRLKVHELHEERLKIIKALAGLILGIIVLVFLLANYIGRFAVVYTQQIHSQPSSASYTHSLQQYFTEQPLQRFTFLLNNQQLNNYMREQHSEIASFTAYGYGSNARFAVTFRKPLLVWQTTSSRFYVDSDGTAFTYDNFGDPLVSVQDQSGIVPDKGSSVASQRFIKFLGQMVGAVNKGGKGQVSSVIIPASTREIDLKLQGRAYPIKTEIDRDPLQQAEDIINALKYFDNHSIMPQYIDVRVAGEAFYK